MFLLDMACQPIREAFPDYGPVLVGTSQTYVKGDPAPRDVDVRCVMKDEAYDALVSGAGIEGVRFFGLAIGQYLASISGLPVDFQFQRATEANEKHKGTRNPLGLRGMGHFAGDAEPER